LKKFSGEEKMIDSFKQKIGLILIFLSGILVLLAGCCGDSGKVDDTNKPSDDTRFFVNAMLEIKDPQFTSKDSEGVEQYDEMKVQQKWGDMYYKYKKLADAGDKTGLKYYLFIAFLAYTQRNAELSEAFSSDLLPIYEKDAGSFLEILKKIPYLIPSSGYYLNKYFGFEDKNAEMKPEFLKVNTPLVNDILGPEEGAIFLENFK
jgi:hypothetical protein